MTKIDYIEKTVVKTINDEYFKEEIIERGTEIYLNGKVSPKELNENSIEANVEGTSTYDVTVELNKDNKIGYAYCNCPYFENGFGYCKHIYASLIALSKEYSKPGFTITLEHIPVETKIVEDNSLKIIANKIEEIINEAMDIFEEIDEPPELEDDLDEIIEYKQLIKIYSNMNQTITPNILTSAHKNLSDLENLYNQFVSDCEDYDEEIMESHELYNNSDYDLKDSFKSSRKVNNSSPIKYWGLSPEERNIVDTTEYEPWNFEEEDLEEDDYYYEDDE